MGYTLCVLGCGTMGIAILSGVVASLSPTSPTAQTPNKWEIHTPGTRTPVALGNGAEDDPALPARFLACVRREETARKLRGVFDALSGGLGRSVEVVCAANVHAVRSADVILLWCAYTVVLVSGQFRHAYARCLFLCSNSCKPQLAYSILAEEGMREALDGKLLISILAGVTIAQLTSWAPVSTRVVRAMPNTPCRVRIYSQFLYMHYPIMFHSSDARHFP
jgi:pyrroline-5-carboxylate reductase